MSLPEGFESLPYYPWHWDGTPWDYDEDEECPWLCSPNGYGVVTGTVFCSKGTAALIASAPDHALLLAAIVRGVATLSTFGYSIFIYRKGGPSEEISLDPLDAFGCPILTDECRTAIIQELEAK